MSTTLVERVSERYEQDVVDRLWALEKDGKGQLRQLCTVKVDGRELPFVAFTTGDQVVVTARHHVNEFFGPTETVMRLAESGQEGLTLVPVVDVEYYGQSEERKQNILRATCVSAAEAVYDMFQGYKGLPSNAQNDWPDYRYMSDDSPSYILAIERLIDRCVLFVDLHNSAKDKFHFLTMPTGIATEAETFEIAVREMENRKQQVDRSRPGSICGKELAPGVYEYWSRGDSGPTVINYAARLGKLNLAVEIPVYTNRPIQPGQWHELNDIGEVAEVTAGTISSLANFCK